MGPLGMTEVIFVLLLALLVFGPRKLPELGRMVARGLAEFRRASNELRSTVENEINSFDRDINTLTDKRVPPSRDQGRKPTPNA